MSRMNQIFSVMSLGLVLVGLSHPVFAAQSQLLYRIEKIGESLRGVTGTESQRAVHLNGIYQSLNSIDLIKEFDHADIKANAAEAINKLFQDRITLRERLAEWEVQKANLNKQKSPEEKALIEPLVSAIRRNFRILRTVEDMIGEVSIDHKKLEKNEQAQTAFTVGGANMVIYPKYANQNFEIQSGDVIVMRGNRYNSAAISKIATHDSQFSHALIVYIDETSGRKFGVESLIETGIVIHDLDKILNEGVGRMILLRYPNPVLAKRAAAIAYQKAYEVNGKGIYDFTFELADSEAFYCSKVVRYAFDKASSGRVVPARYLSELPQDKNGDFLRRIGVTARRTIAPGDMELDTRFDLVAEWRDFRVTRDLRLKEIVINKIFEMMEYQGYKFVPSRGVETAAALAKAASETPLLSAIVTKVAGQIPSYMTEEIIATMMMLQFTADPMHEALEKADDEFNRQHPGFVMSPSQLYQTIQKMVVEHKFEFKYLKK